jgi:hypothetical protein
MIRIVIAVLGLLWAEAASAASLPVSLAVAPQDPGPSASLFASPYYSCKSNYYVSPTGSDSNTGTVGSPWLTLQHANDSGHLTAGACVNVAPGTYSGVSLTTGGNLASSTGYVVWRCTTMDACTVNGTASPNGNVGFYAAGTGVANYVIIDGFTITGNSSVYGLGVEFAGTTNGVPGIFASHHDWVLNSVISGFGQGGIGFNEGDYTYAIHNKIYNNATGPSCDNGAQGSGLGDNIPLDIAYQYSSYTATADDKTNPNSLIGSFVTGSSWFHKVYEWNVLYNNHLTPCSTATGGDTDGNNIILDTFGTYNGNTVAYPDQTLIAFNVTYNAGGGGIHIFASEYATVANNTCYNNGIDPYNGGTSGGGACIDTTNSYGNTILNNIAVAIPNAPPPGGCAFPPGTIPGATTFNSAILGGGLSGATQDTFSNNITQLQGGHYSCWGGATTGNRDAPTGENPMFNNDTYSCSSNKCATNPMWTNVGGTSTGSESTPPIGANFALQLGSPAIGYGLTQTYLPAQSVDVGACYHTLTSCP